MRLTILISCLALAAAATPASAQLCTPGFFGPVGGVAPCSPCPAGSFSDTEGSLVCSVCPQGTFQPNEGSIACETCPDGFIAPNVASIQCEPCPEGFTSNETHTACIENSVPAEAVTWGVLKATYN